MQADRFSILRNTKTRVVSNTERKQFFPQFGESNRPYYCISGGIISPSTGPNNPFLSTAMFAGIAVAIAILALVMLLAKSRSTKPCLAFYSRETTDMKMLHNYDWRGTFRLGE